jgi:hypothetical protein
LLTVISVVFGGPARTQDLFVPRSRPIRRSVGLEDGVRGVLPEAGVAIGSAFVEEAVGFSTVSVDIIGLFLVKADD